MQHGCGQLFSLLLLSTKDLSKAFWEKNKIPYLAKQGPCMCLHNGHVFPHLWEDPCLSANPLPNFSGWSFQSKEWPNTQKYFCEVSCFSTFLGTKRLRTSQVWLAIKEPLVERQYFKISLKAFQSRKEPWTIHSHIPTCIIKYLETCEIWP